MAKYTDKELEEMANTLNGLSQQEYVKPHYPNATEGSIWDY